MELEIECICDDTNCGNYAEMYSYYTNIFCL